MLAQEGNGLSPSPSPVREGRKRGKRVLTKFSNLKSLTKGMEMESKNFINFPQK